MNWAGASDFFRMGGYALYVWGSFGACAACLALEAVFLGRRRAAAVRSVRRHAQAARMEREAR